MHPRRLPTGMRAQREGHALLLVNHKQFLEVSTSCGRSLTLFPASGASFASPTSTLTPRGFSVSARASVATRLRHVGETPMQCKHPLTTSSRAYRDGNRDNTRSTGVPTAFPSAVAVPYSSNLIIGDVSMPVPDYARHPERVPWVVPGTYDALQELLVRASGERVARGENMFFSISDPLTRYYLRWLCQKELLGQDMCLVGDPGPALRWLVLLYAHLTRREVCLVSLNRDITESDLKQRREIRNGTLVYEDQSAVTAAKEGHLLVLEGLERVERNVLPVINNLLENREMHLDNGAVLIHPARYDSLYRDAVQARLAQAARTGTTRHAASDVAHLAAEAHADLSNMGLLRVSEKFRVVGLTVPVPPYEGSPLDPPLRSRFQCLYVRTGLPTMPTSSESPFLLSARDAAQAANVARLQEQRLHAMVKLHAAIEAINAATGAFANSRPSSGERASGGGRGGSGRESARRSQHSRKGGRGGVEDDASSDQAQSGSLSQPIRNLAPFGMSTVARQLHLFPDMPVGEALVRGFPWPLYAQAHGSGAGGGTVNPQESQKATSRYQSILADCGIEAPLMTTSTADAPSVRRGSVHTASEQVSAAFRALVGSGKGEAEARAFVQDTNLLNSVHHGDDQARPATVPQTVSEASNYVLRLEAPRMCPCEGAEPPGQGMCVADAVVATATQCDAQKGGGRGTYTVPVTVGRYAELHLLKQLPRTGTANTALPVVDVAERCAGSNMVLTTGLYHTLQTMLQLHAARQHMLLVGAPGSGKTALIREFAHLLGYEVEAMHLYADMTSKDLFQRRTTETETGNTTWDNAALVDAAIHGRLVVLDGVDKLPPGMLTSLQQLLIDQSVSLFDGTTLKSQSEYAILKEKMSACDATTGVITRRATDAEMRDRKIFPIHPAFRVVATARPPGSGVSPGAGGGGASGRDGVLSHDVTTLFGVVVMPEASRATLEPVLHQVAMREMEAMADEGLLSEEALSARRSTARTSVDQLLRLREEVAVLRHSDPKIMPLTFRQLLHLTRGAVRFPEQLALSVSNALLVSLMTGVTLTQMEDALGRCGLRLDASRRQSSASSNSPAQESLRLEASAPSTSRRVFTVGGVPVLTLERHYTSRELALVPFVSGFYGNPVHDTIIAWLAKQYGIGANILLIGNQGVGKNKVIDAFLAHVQIPRHYLQLHRDTTVGSLTINPTVEGGKVRWEDSPLVKAVQQGHCLVVDEIDKAPVEVVQVLKGLIEDKEMRLGDGRRIVDAELYAKIQATGADTKGLVAIHPDFRIIVLANPPGFPFHGNDFFRECGDLFSSYVMANPDRASQLQVLEAYAPNLPQSLLVSLIEAFRRLQDGFSQGNLSYPFSLRELIAVVKHLSRFPQDGVYEALNNVFNFDTRDENTLRYVRQVMNHYLSAHTTQGASARLLPLRAGLPHKLTPLPEPIVIPYEHTVTSSSSPGAPTIPAGQPLGALLHANPSQLRAALARVTAECPPLLFWKQRFSEGDFQDREAGASMTAEGFTEWMSVRTMPFIDAATDAVLAVTATGQYAHTRESGSFISFLLLRQSKDRATPTQSRHHGRYVLATVRLPPAPLDNTFPLHTSVTGAGVGAGCLLCWPMGEVHFMDLTSAMAYAGLDPCNSTTTSAQAHSQDASLRLEDFNAASLVGVWNRSSEAVGDGAGVLKLRSHASLGWSDDAEPHAPPTLLLTHGGKSMLIDVLASPSTVAPLSLTIHTTPATQSNGNRAADAVLARATVEDADVVASMRFELRGALLPISLSALIPGQEDTATQAAQAGAFSPAGLLWQTTRSSPSGTTSNTLYLLSEGCVVSVAAPLPVAKVRFVSAHLAAVSMRLSAPVPATPSSSVADELVDGVLHVVVHPTTADVYARFTALPKSVARHLEVVDVLPASAPTLASTTPSTMQSAARELLRGLVLAPRGSNSHAPSTAPTASGRMDAAFMVVEDAEDAHVKVRLYPSDTRTGPSTAPLSVDPLHHQLIGPGGVVVDVAAGTVRQLASTPLSHGPTRGDDQGRMWSVNMTQSVATTYAPSSRQVSVADLDVERVQRRYEDWSAMLTGNAGYLGDGADPDSEKRVKPFHMTYSAPRKQPSGTLKHGEVDDKEHHGGNTWAGGTGGTDTAGLGGLVGPYRLDKGNTVHQVSPEDKRKVPKHLIEEARRMGKEALRERLAAIGMSEEEYGRYNELQERVRPSINQLRTLLMGLKAAEGERAWLKGQSDGVWDDKKLVEGIVGEKNVYKRRVDTTNTNPFLQKRKKRVVFVLDVSASMYRFEGMDHRLTKLIESTIMVMEAFAGFESKIDYCLMGHNGDDEAIELVNFGQPPANQRERMDVCMKMVAFAQYCWSGDNTVEAMRHSLKVVTAEKGDAYFVFVISDANLRQYGITPQELSHIILSRKPEVQMFCIFIATLGAQASQLQAQLPAGHGYECMQTDELPHILRKIFSSVNLL